MVFFADVSVVEYSCCRENSNCAECHSSPALSDLNESPGDSRCIIALRVKDLGSE